MSAASRAAHDQESTMKRFATIPSATLLLLAFALPAAARHPDRLERERTPVARGFVPQLHCSALELDGLTRRLLRHARRDTGDPSRAERRALRQLRRLRAEAREFRITAERGRRGRALARDFDDLEHRFADAARRFHALGPDRRLRRDFRRVARAMASLDRQLDRRMLARRWQ